MNNSNCNNCVYKRMDRCGPNYFKGFCKCTGQDIDFYNVTIKSPEWCPISKQEDSK